ncbi:hypothetical protein PAQ31011_00686 [Pandoraea aquatica]|uniref:Uncharacterized protein n=1 Tax=Pandoraea aquatica TaxID=2508290 RepID=A0A5E4SES9_9BURK|nr:hypothetical protein PAQ31011_00686 [Pandoraea aquatica]
MASARVHDPKRLERDQQVVYCHALTEHHAADTARCQPSPRSRYVTQKNLTLLPDRQSDRHRDRTTQGRQGARADSIGTMLSMHVCIEGVLLPLHHLPDAFPAGTLATNTRILEKTLQSFPSIKLSLHTRRLNEKSLRELLQKLPDSMAERFTPQSVEHLNDLWRMPDELSLVKTAPESPLICIEHSWTPIPNWAIPWTFMVHPYFGLSEARTHLALTSYVKHIFERSRWTWK